MAQHLVATHLQYRGNAVLDQINRNLLINVNKMSKYFILKQ